jgi:hypothetical protein
VATIVRSRFPPVFAEEEYVYVDFIRAAVRVATVPGDRSDHDGRLRVPACRLTVTEHETLQLDNDGTRSRDPRRQLVVRVGYRASLKRASKTLRHDLRPTTIEPPQLRSPTSTREQTLGKPVK